MPQPLMGAAERHSVKTAFMPFDGRVAAVLAVSLLLLGALFFREGRAAVEVWNASTAYSHCYLILPMALYLLWERRAVFQRIAPEPELRWALLAVPITVTWLVAERLGFMEGRQLAAIAGLEVVLLTVLGWRLFSLLSGPLLFLFFLVPFGAFLTPALQQFTAVFSITGLNVLGIPNFSDQLTIETPAGVFFVAEACAGLRFLIAAVAFGVFFALLSYVSPLRRGAFIVASIIVPIVANGFRALGIVVLGQILGSAQAAAADHIIYGWVFFSIVMLLLIAVGQIFREDVASHAAPLRPDQPRRHGSAGLGALTGVLVLCAGPALAAVIDAGSTAPVLALGPLVTVPAGCTGVPGGTSPNDQSGALVCEGTRFDIRADTFPPRSTSSAMVAERRRVAEEAGAENVTVLPGNAPDGAGRWTLVQTTDPNRLTGYASWIDGQPSRSGLEGRVAQARDSLFGSDFAPVLITITAAEAPNSSPVSRKAVLSRMMQLIQAQGGLTDRIIAASRVSPGGSTRQ